MFELALTIAGAIVILYAGSMAAIIIIALIAKMVLPK